MSKLNGDQGCAVVMIIFIMCIAGCTAVVHCSKDKVMIKELELRIEELKHETK